MKRRKFLESLGIIGGAAIAIPKVLLPSPADLEHIVGRGKKIVVEPDTNGRGKNFITISGNTSKGKLGEKVSLKIDRISHSSSGDSYPRVGDLVMFRNGVVGYIVGKDNILFKNVIYILPVRVDECIPAIKDQELIVIAGNTFAEGQGTSTTHYHELD